MDEYNGHERRESTNLDWLQHKENILSQLKDLKRSTSKTDEKVTTMQVSLAILNTKMMMASMASSFIVATVISIIGLVIK